MGLRNRLHDLTIRDFTTSLRRFHEHGRHLFFLHEFVERGSVGRQRLFQLVGLDVDFGDEVFGTFQAANSISNSSCQRARRKRSV